MPPRRSFAQLLKSFRARSGLTQEALAVASGLSVEAIRALEGGRRRNPRPVSTEQLAGALGLTAGERLRLEAAASRRSPEPSAAADFPAALDDFTGRQHELAELVR